MPDVLDKDYTKLILDILCDITGLSASLVYNEENICSQKHYPTFCKAICEEIDDKVCSSLLPQADKIIMCRAGLYCKSIPITLGTGGVGYLIIGHRRVFGKDELSKNALNELLKNYGKYNQSDIAKFLTYFNEVPIVEEEAFEIPGELINKINSLSEIIKLEHEIIENERRRSVELKSLAANLAHQLLLPLQSIIGYASIINDELEDNSELKKYSNNMLSEIKKLAYYAENISNYMANESARFSYNMELTNINDLIYDTIELFRREADAKGIKIADPIWINGAPKELVCSEPHIKQVLFNIYNNAVKYSYQGSSGSDRYIRTLCSKEGDKFKLEVTNYGVGITDEEINKGLIFQEGYRGVLSKDYSRTGSGLGLWTVKRVIEDHNGHVQVKSRPVAQSNKPDRGDPYLTSIIIAFPYGIIRRRSNEQ